MAIWLTVIAHNAALCQVLALLDNMLVKVCRVCDVCVCFPLWIYDVYVWEYMSDGGYSAITEGCIKPCFVSLNFQLVLAYRDACKLLYCSK